MEAGNKYNLACTANSVYNKDWNEICLQKGMILVLESKMYAKGAVGVIMPLLY